jgi:aminopeptidase-like protein
MHCVPSGTKVLDWVVPNEWLIRDAYVADLYGNKLIDWTENNLHVVGYSVPVEEILTLEELLPHLHWLTDHPDAVPYVTSYYRRDWGFCLPASQVGTLGPGPFRVRIDSEIRPGQLDYAEAVIPGATEREVLLTSYVCHPSMANNELSGPVVLTALGRWLKTLPSRRYTYRLLLAPETIGPIAYIDTHLEQDGFSHASETNVLTHTWSPGWAAPSLTDALSPFYRNATQTTGTILTLTGGAMRDSGVSRESISPSVP